MGLVKRKPDFRIFVTRHYSDFSARVNVGTYGQCSYNRTLLYFLDNFSAASVVIAMCNPD